MPVGDTELHFPSKNPTEENGAVLTTYQSAIPGFRGRTLSTDESLRSSASMRLLSHMLREPLFDELRTKQQLGYIVHSYYDLSFSSPGPKKSGNKPCMTAVDSLVISVLSKKVPPAEIAQRIDTFLEDFRSSLANTPESEIESHANALKTKLLKPIQKLGSEASTQFSKIRRYSPEILSDGGSGQDLPWDSVKVLATEIGKLKREDLLAAWDRLIPPKSRSRIISHVYGSTFPLPDETRGAASGSKVVDSLDNLVKLRGRLNRYGEKPAVFGLLRHASSSKMMYAGAAAAVVGIGYLSFTLFNRNKKSSK